MSFVVVEVFLDKSHISGIIEASRFSFHVFHLSLFFSFLSVFSHFFIYSSFILNRKNRRKVPIVTKTFLLVKNLDMRPW